MFKCQITNKISKPGEKQFKIVTETRQREYTEESWNRKEKISVTKTFYGSEIVKEILLTEEGYNLYMTDVMDLFSSKGGMQVGAMLEGLEATEAGQKVVNKLTNKTDSKGYTNGATKN